MTKETKKQIDHKIVELFTKAKEYKESLNPNMTDKDIAELCEKKATTCKTVLYGYLDALEDLGLVTKSDRTDAMWKLTVKVTSLYFNPMW